MERCQLQEKIQQAADKAKATTRGSRQGKMWEVPTDQRGEVSNSTARWALRKRARRAVRVWEALMAVKICGLTIGGSRKMDEGSADPLCYDFGSLEKKSLGAKCQRKQSGANRMDIELSFGPGAGPGGRCSRPRPTVQVSQRNDAMVCQPTRGRQQGLRILADLETVVSSETGWEARERFEGIAGHGADVGDGEVVWPGADGVAGDGGGTGKLAEAECGGGEGCDV